jgi:hypothetical protein
MMKNVSLRSYRICACAAVAIAVSGAAVSAGADEIVLQHGNRPDASYVQNATSIASEYPVSTARATGDLLVGNNKAGSSYRALLDFDLSAIPAGAEIQSVSLRMMQSADPNTEGGAKVTVEVYLFNGTIDEKSSCWKSAEGKTGALLQTSEVELLSGQQSKDRIFKTSTELAGAVQEALKAGTKLNLVVKLKDENFIGRRLVMFRGNEYTSAASRPSLTVSYKPATVIGAFSTVNCGDRLYAAN